VRLSQSRHLPQRHILLPIVLCASVLLLAYFLGKRPSMMIVGALIGIGAAFVILQRPALSPLVLIVAGLAVPMGIGTGTEVRLGSAAFAVPALVLIWLLDSLRQRKLNLPSSATSLPLLLFLLMGIISLLIGTALWDPMVPRPGNLLLVQLAQWAIFAFSGIAFWLMAGWGQNEGWLRRITLGYLLIGGILTAIWASPARPLVLRLLAVEPGYPPLLVLTGALAAAELLYDRQLSTRWRWFLAAVLIAVIYQTFVGQRESVSTLVGVLAAGGVLTWLRFPRLRWAIVVLIIAFALSGILFPAAWEFAGGDSEWQASGGSRLVLAGRVIEETMRNPITGLGPAAYRAYARIKPLPYQNAYWREPLVSAHNNWVDLFSHVGLAGLGLFVWFMVEVARLGFRLRKRTTGFALGYTHAMLAVWTAMMVMMAFGDWFLPFVYNLGFPAFQGSVLVWLFLGGLVALKNMGEGETRGQGERETGER